MSELAKFAKSFKSEENLRNAVATLLLKLPHISGVRIVHGPQEYGKDIIFYAKGAFLEQRLHACLLKNAKITGSVDGSTSARVMLMQAEQALDVPWINQKGAEERVDQVYILSPYEVSPTTINSIMGRLRERSGQITFCCGIQLFELFRKYWPEYFLFETPILSAYLARLNPTSDTALQALFSQYSFSAPSRSPSTFLSNYINRTFKVVLQTHELKIAEISSSWPAKVVAESGLPGLIRYLKLLGYLAIEAETWPSDDSSVGNRLLSAAEELADKSHLETPALADLVSGLTPEIHFAQKHLSLLSDRVTAANAFVKGHSDTPPKLGTPELLNYSFVQELATLFPEIVSSSSPSKVFNFFEDGILESTSSVFVTAPAGYGKTAFCRAQMLRIVNRLTTAGLKEIPVLIPLYQLAHAQLRTYEDLLFYSPELRDIAKLAQTTDLSFRVFLDGLDELPSISSQQTVLRLAREAMIKHPDWQLIITAQENSFALWPAFCSRVQMTALTESQLHQLVENWCDNQRDMAELFFWEASQVPVIRPLLGTPLFTILAVVLFRNPNLGGLPGNKVRLYETYIDLLCGGWDLARNIRRGGHFGGEVKKRILARLAGITHARRRRTVTTQDIQIAAEELNLTLLRLEDVTKDLLVDGLLVKAGLDFAFSHLSFQEYFAALDLLSIDDQKATNILRQFLKGDDWWKGVLSFYIAMSSSPKQISDWIRAVAASAKNVDYAKRLAVLNAEINETFPDYTSAPL